jgi:hypothetical protein
MTFLVATRIQRQKQKIFGSGLKVDKLTSPNAKDFPSDETRAEQLNFSAGLLLTS